MVEQSVPSARSQPSSPATTDTICPFLLADGGAWRASTATRAHRCTAVTPPALLAVDKQRRLCLIAEHDGCATYAAARALRLDATRVASPVHERPTARLVARTTPLVLDHGRLALSAPTHLRFDRSMGQVALVVLMVLAFAAILVARLSTAGGVGPAGVAGATGTPAPSTVLVAGPDASAGGPGASGGAPDSGSTVPPSDEPGAEQPTAAPSAEQPTTAPEGTAGPSDTYVVRSGDTLSGIASEFGTTWQELAALNDIDDPGSLRVGQELQIP
jgi:LysM repeat protein